MDDLDRGTESALRLFEVGCDEANVMIFPVFDYFEIKDWLENFVKSQCSEFFDPLRDMRNYVRGSLGEKKFNKKIGIIERNSRM